MIEQVYIRAIAHAHCRNAQPVYSPGVPPVGTGEEGDLLLGCKFLDEFGDRRLEKVARHGAV